MSGSNLPMAFTFILGSSSLAWFIKLAFDCRENTEKLNKLENRDLISAGEVIYIPEPGGLKNLVVPFEKGLGYIRKYKKESEQEYLMWWRAFGLKVGTLMALLIVKA